jgi:hypothetical protein
MIDPQLHEPCDLFLVSRRLRRCVRRRAFTLAREQEARLYLRYAGEILALIDDGELTSAEDIESWTPAL